MKLKSASTNVLAALGSFLDEIDQNAFASPLPILSEASIGQHTRHILEFFQCLIEQAGDGEVNYDLRKRDLQIEMRPAAAEALIEWIISELESQNFPEQLTLTGSYDDRSKPGFAVMTSFDRELAYNIEHAIHHMAIIRIGLKVLAPGIELPENFGIAASTIRYRKSESQ